MNHLLIFALLVCSSVHAQVVSTFATIGDFGNDSPAEALVANLIHARNPDFILTVGDNNYLGGSSADFDRAIGKYYHDFIWPYTGAYGPGAMYNRFWPSIGNHDYINGFGGYTGYFTLPGNERYYSWVFPQGLEVFFINSDSHESDGTSSTSTQAQVMGQLIRNSSANWKIAVFHHPPYSSGSHGSSTGMRWQFENWGVDAVLTGHDHDYERLMVDQNSDGRRIPFYVIGMGGADLRSFDDNPLSQTAVRFDQHHGALMVTYSTHSMTLDFVNTSGITLDSLVISPQHAQVSGLVLR